MAEKQRTPAEKEYIDFLENRCGHPLTESQKSLAIRQARLCAELMPFLKEIAERLPERTPQELKFIASMEKYRGRPLTEP
jgi:hypothetical protein